MNFKIYNMSFISFIFESLKIIAKKYENYVHRYYIGHIYYV